MTTADTKVFEWRVANLDCEKEARVIEDGLSKVPGLTNVSVNPHAAKVSFSIGKESPESEELQALLAQWGFPVIQSRSIPAPPPVWRNVKVLVSAGSGLLLGATYLMETMTSVPSAATASLYGAGMLLGGWFFMREAITDLINNRVVGIELLMATASIAAFLLGQHAEALVLVFLYSIAEALEGYTEDKTRNAVRALMHLAPSTATVLRGDVETEIPVEELRVGDVFTVRPGQSIPTDGVVVQGSSHVNQATLTGESHPVKKTIKDQVFAGTSNDEGVLFIEATRTTDENTLARIIRLVEDAQEKKAKSEQLIRRFGRWYSPFVLLSSVLLAVIPGFLTGEWLVWAVRATVFIVSASPCALIISVPIATVAALGTGARMGILIKGGNVLEQLSKIRVFAFDKTGTLTIGKPRVMNVIAIEGTSEEELLEIAANVERYSKHPLAQAIVFEAARRGSILGEVADFGSVTGKGVQATYQQRKVFIGKPEWVAAACSIESSELPDTIGQRARQGETVVYLGTKDVWLGAILIGDSVRPNAAETIARLRQYGIRHVTLLTGDHPGSAESIARETGVDGFHADCTPEDKSRIIAEIQVKYGETAMIGDGVNDAPALASASVGFAMGAAGSDVALETADVALLSDDLSKIPQSILLARRTRRIVRQNLILSLVVITALVTVSFFGATLPIAVIAHELSELVVILNGLRLLRG